MQGDRERRAEFPVASSQFLIAPISPRQTDSAQLFSEDLQTGHSVGPHPLRPLLEVCRERIGSCSSGSLWENASQST